MRRAGASRGSAFAVEAGNGRAVGDFARGACVAASAAVVIVVRQVEADVSAFGVTVCADAGAVGADFVCTALGAGVAAVRGGVSFADVAVEVITGFAFREDASFVFAFAGSPVGDFVGAGDSMCAAVVDIVGFADVVVEMADCIASSGHACGLVAGDLSAVGDF